MRSRPSLLKFGALALAVVLTGSYVWFKTAQAQERDRAILPGSKVGHVRLRSATTTTAPATNEFQVIYSSKSAPVDLTRSVRSVTSETVTTDSLPTTSPTTAPADTR